MFGWAKELATDTALCVICVVGPLVFVLFSVYWNMAFGKGIIGSVPVSLVVFFAPISIAISIAARKGIIQYYQHKVVKAEDWQRTADSLIQDELNKRRYAI
jgi:hypothetical protein